MTDPNGLDDKKLTKSVIINSWCHTLCSIYTTKILRKESDDFQSRWWEKLLWEISDGVNKIVELGNAGCVCITAVGVETQTREENNKNKYNFKNQKISFGLLWHILNNEVENFKINL